MPTAPIAVSTTLCLARTFETYQPRPRLMQRFLSEFLLEPFRIVEIRRYFLKCQGVETFPVNFGIKFGRQCEREDFMRLAFMSRAIRTRPKTSRWRDLIGVFTRRRVALVLRVLIRLPVLPRVADIARHRDPTLRLECRQKSLSDVPTKTSANVANWPAGHLHISLHSPASRTFDEWALSLFPL